MCRTLLARLSRRPLVAVLALALGAVAFGAAGPAPTASADSPPCAAGCTIEVEFQTLDFLKLDDCGFGEPCSPTQASQAYGSFAATTWKAGVFGPIKKLKLAGWGSQPGSCPSFGVPWTDGSLSRAGCFRTVFEHEGESTGCTTCGPSTDESFHLAQTFLCTASSNTACNAGFKKNNNRVRLTVKPGQLIFVSALVYDYDAASGDDVICDVSDWFGPFTATQLATLAMNGTASMGFNGDGACSLTMSVRHVN